eukprot:CAMPEP_0198227076 /NCGR_PEP_ID=MMETSP1445-20131203/107785_1 /TAXON_ID=36898 /ORGANISM="Pyramimonas sp., Strain CCMP2087" /LENGTH=290 /DNA_ID=CAMNT_0043907033 /DNA_START=406 /DNA_END=1275 /DNA_ORIENTATION=+
MSTPAPPSRVGKAPAVDTLASVESNSWPYPERPGVQECSFFIRTGTCRYGATCKYHHPSDKVLPSYSLANESFHVPQTSADLPVRLEMPVCSYYSRTGRCKYGSSCKFNHPPADTRMAQCHVAPPLGSSSTAVMSQLAYPPAGNVQPMMNNQPQVQQMVNSSNLAAAAAMGRGSGVPPHMAPVQTQGQMPGQLPWPYLTPPMVQQVTPLTILAPPSPDDFPERQNTTDCTFYLKTGRCRFANTCKFNHPKNRQAAAEASGMVSMELNALGLPLREDEATCTFYLRTGFCK